MLYGLLALLGVGVFALHHKIMADNARPWMATLSYQNPDYGKKAKVAVLVLMASGISALAWLLLVGFGLLAFGALDPRQLPIGPGLPFNTHSTWALIIAIALGFGTTFVMLKRKPEVTG